MDPKWLYNEKMQELLSDSASQHWEMNKHSGFPRCVWDAFKAYTRGQYISAIKSAKVDHNAHQTVLEQAESNATARFSSFPPREIIPAYHRPVETWNSLTSITHTTDSAGGVTDSGDKNSRLYLSI